jgi:hypothetical protein
MRSIAAISGVVILLVLGCFAFVPWESDAADNEAIVRVEYPGPYWGTIRGDEEQIIEMEGTQDYEVTGQIIYVIMNKADESDQEMTVSIIVNGAPRVTESTSDPLGEVRLSFSFGAGLNDDDDDEEEDGDDNFGCQEIMIASSAVLTAGVLILVKRKTGK